MTTAAATMDGGNNDSNWGFFDGDGSNATGNSGRRQEGQQQRAIRMGNGSNNSKGSDSGKGSDGRDDKDGTEGSKSNSSKCVDAARH